MTSFTCPHCGGQLTLSAVGAHPGALSRRGFRQVRRYEHHVPWAERGESVDIPPLPLDVAELVRERPARGMTGQGDFLVPLGWSVVSGGFAMGGTLALMLAFRWPLEGAAFTSLAAMFVTAGATWWWRMSEHSRSMWDVERIVGRDLDGDGMVGEPETLRVEVNAGERLYIWEVAGVGQRQYRTFCRAALSGLSLAVNSWVGGKHPFTRAQYDGLMRELIRAGLVEDRGGNVGRVLTDRGKQAFRQVIDRLGPPSPLA